MGDEPQNKKPDAPCTPEAKSPSKDVVLIHGKTADGKGLAVLRHRENRLEHGLVLPVEHGKPIVGEVVTLQPRPEFPLLCDVNVEYSPDANKPEAQERRQTKGPGQVATDVYRANWERIFQPQAKARGELN